MPDKSEYKKNVSDVLNYFNKSFKEPAICFDTGLEKIYYYTTKYLINLPPELNKKLDKILQYEIHKNQIFNVNDMHGQIYLHQGDITQIRADAIVNAANADGLGCFEYKHKCIDNIIHNKAGPGVRFECNLVLSGSKIRT